MLEKIRNQENIILMFLAVIVLGVSIYSYFNRGLFDIIYLGVLVYYFGRFLVVRFRR